ncbi:MAG: tRNA 4-thiouridine(8) synthase ThiI, partial [Spirochaetaceae bacterium]|nr:tRNA 4-thiouridine(8) synthase ThiI [Spirochaetaceae bacterium]
MEALYLVKIGEIILKLGNRKEFEDRLKNDLKRRLEGVAGRIDYNHGRIFIEVDAEKAAFVEAVLARTPGINGFARARRVSKDPATVLATALEVAKEEAARGKLRFKAESRRSDKSFPLDSYALSAEIGHRVLEGIPGTRVDLHRPEFTVYAEIRERAYVYSSPTLGPRGLPVGSQGLGLLLLSGGIDSPVAGYLMAKRGLDF